MTHPDDGPERVEGPDRSRERDARTGADAAAARIAQQQTWVDLQVRQAMERGEFDDLPGAGKPLEGLGTEHDPDWWIKKLVEREQIAVLPPAIALRKEDAELDSRLDRLNTEDDVRREVTDFNERVRRTLYSNPGGPPVVTSQRDADAEVTAWRERRTARLAANRAALQRAREEQARAEEERRTRRRRWSRRRS
jgi:hypothetical protein